MTNMTTMANSRNGKLLNTWMTKEITASTLPPKYPAATPAKKPMTRAMAWDTTPTESDTRQP